MVDKVLIDPNSEANRFKGNALIPELFDQCDIMPTPGSHVSKLLPMP